MHAFYGQLLGSGEGSHWSNIKCCSLRLRRAKKGGGSR